MTAPFECLEPWLDDGNIVLAAEGRCFRVHRTILASHSEVFKEMFAVPRSDDVEEDAFDGCPLVYLQDAFEEVQIMLNTFYGRGYIFFRDTPMPITALTAFLHMGKKYAVRQLFEEGVRRLSPDLPHLEYASKISNEKDMTLFPRVSGTDPYNFMIMNIANDMGCLFVVAVAVYYCCIACPAPFITDGYDFNGTRCTLSFLNQRYCFLGQRHVAESQREISSSLANAIRDKYYRSGCSSHYALRCFLRSRGPFIAWQNAWRDYQCAACKDVEGKYEETRTRLWQDLPVKLGLGSWDELRAEGIFLERVPNAE